MGVASIICLRLIVIVIFHLFNGGFNTTALNTIYISNKLNKDNTRIHFRLFTISFVRGVKESIILYFTFEIIKSFIISSSTGIINITAKIVNIGVSNHSIKFIGPNSYSCFAIIWDLKDAIIYLNRGKMVGTAGTAGFFKIFEWA